MLIPTSPQPPLRRPAPPPSRLRLHQRACRLRNLRRSGLRLVLGLRHPRYSIRLNVPEMPADYLRPLRREPAPLVGR
jgi:hypothetical protein